ncbi:hypothetical protein Pmani_011360 [Petrolisthes manimaculis]|uniref:Uncharacterized protein n=1 Tax=Petrolisthes manimaculis TaxID=1843537 RepID=A0AAE1UEI1_9EUCA|nr:hypothetical protein Pmani_011360 [Petrolisthes manimaculis]
MNKSPQLTRPVHQLRPFQAIRTNLYSSDTLIAHTVPSSIHAHQRFYMYEAPPPSPLTPSPLTPTSLTPTSLTPTSLTPTSLTPSPLTPTSLTPTSLTPTSLTPTSLTSTSLTSTSLTSTSLVVNLYTSSTLSLPYMTTTGFRSKVRGLRKVRKVAMPFSKVNTK